MERIISSMFLADLFVRLLLLMSSTVLPMPSLKNALLLLGFTLLFIKTFDLPFTINSLFFDFVLYHIVQSYSNLNDAWS